MSLESMLSLSCLGVLWLVPLFYSGTQLEACVSGYQSILTACQRSISISSQIHGFRDYTDVHVRCWTAKPPGLRSRCCALCSVFLTHCFLVFDSVRNNLLWPVAWPPARHCSRSRRSSVYDLGKIGSLMVCFDGSQCGALGPMFMA